MSEVGYPVLVLVMYRRKHLQNLLVKRKKSKTPIVYINLARIFALLGIFFLSASYGPAFYYSVLNKQWVERNTKLIGESALETKDFSLRSLNSEYELPSFDPLLPKENTLIINTLKIDTPIVEAPIDSYDQAIRKGVWRVTNFGNPEDGNFPTILTAHRFGYLSWSVSYRLKNSFYKLPDLSVGDTVVIIWKQRKYIYEVYSEGKGSKIDDYSADLILYTCQDLKSDVRIFKYAKRLQV